MRKGATLIRGCVVVLATTLCMSKLSLAGTIVAWGDNSYGQCSVPSGDNFVAVAAGGWHSLALRKDSSLTAWGNNTYGQCDVPAGNDFVAIAAGAYHSLAIKSDGSLVACGWNKSSQCNVPSGNNFVAIAAGAYHSLALRSDGSVTAWGDNTYGQCNLPSGNNFVAVAGNGHQSRVFKRDGSAVMCGSNEYHHMPASSEFAAVVGGAFHAVGLRLDRSLRAWGWNKYGQCDVPEGNDFVAVAAGGRHSLALQGDGAVVQALEAYSQFDTYGATEVIAIARGLYSKLVSLGEPAIMLVLVSAAVILCVVRRARPVEVRQKSRTRHKQRRFTL